MLVYFHKSFLMEGTATFETKKYLWSRPEYTTQNIYCAASVRGICDDSELDAEVEKHVKAELKTGGWGYKFHGWHRVVPYFEACDLAKELKWDKDYHIPTNEVRTEPVNEWPMTKIIKELNGKQFAQFCRENNIYQLRR